MLSRVAVKNCKELPTLTLRVIVTVRYSCLGRLCTTHTGRCEVYAPFGAVDARILWPCPESVRTVPTRIGSGLLTTERFLGSFYDPNALVAIQVPDLQEPLCHGLNLRPPELEILSGGRASRLMAGFEIFLWVIVPACHACQ